MICVIYLTDLSQFIFSAINGVPFLASLKRAGIVLVPEEDFFCFFIFFCTLTDLGSFFLDFVLLPGLDFLRLPGLLRFRLYFLDRGFNSAPRRTKKASIANRILPLKNASISPVTPVIG